MANLLILKADEFRCYEHIADILTFSALTIGGSKVLFAAPQMARFACRAGDVDIIAPLNGFDDTLASGKIPEVIKLICNQKMPEPDEEHSIPGLKSVIARIIAAIFAVFANKANDWVKKNISTDYYNWPPVSEFARVVRNAIVHGGTINLKDPQIKACWLGVEFSAANYGEPVLNAGKLSLGDLILVMLNLEEELDSLGAPFDLG